ncbi:MAG: two-component regulator propeller domain-containing protein, partial [Chloroflexaceae bacterium]
MLSHARLPLFTSLALALALLLAALLSRGSARADRLAATLPPPDAPAWVIWETHPPVQRVTLAGETLWAGTSQGLWQWDRTTGPVAAVDLGPGFPARDVLAVVGTAEATWVALGAGGVARIAPDGTVTPLDLPAGMHSPVWDLAVAGSDLWLATRGSGVLHYDGATWTQFTRATAALPSDEVATIALNSRGQPWIGTFDAGVATLNGATWISYALPTSITSPLGGSTPLPNQAVTDLVLDATDTPWVASDGSGLLRLDGVNAPAGAPPVRAAPVAEPAGPWVFYLPLVAAGPAPAQALVDPAAAQWTVYDPRNSGLPGTFVQQIQFDPAGNLWVGTLGHGVARLAPDRQTWSGFTTTDTPLATDDILDVAPDAAGGLWLTSYDVGLAYYGPLPDPAPPMDLDPRGQPTPPPAPTTGYTLGLDPESFTWTLGRHSDGDAHRFSGDLQADGPITLTRAVEGGTVTDNRLVLDTTTDGGDQVRFTLDRAVTTLTVRLQIDGASYPLAIRVGRTGARPGTAPFQLAVPQPQPPQVVALADPLTVDEGSLVWFSGKYTDPDSPTGQTYHWDLGD